MEITQPTCNCAGYCVNKNRYISCHLQVHNATLLRGKAKDNLCQVGDEMTENNRLQFTPSVSSLRVSSDLIQRDRAHWLWGSILEILRRHSSLVLSSAANSQSSGSWCSIGLRRDWWNLQWQRLFAAALGEEDNHIQRSLWLQSCRFGKRFVNHILCWCSKWRWLDLLLGDCKPPWRQGTSRYFALASLLDAIFKGISIPWEQIHSSFWLHSHFHLWQNAFPIHF